MTGGQDVTETRISVEDAEEYTQSLGQIFGGGWRQIALGKRMGVPQALGLSIQEWVQQRLGGYTNVPRIERQDAVKELTAPAENGGYGMTQSEAAEVLGIAQGTVSKDLSGKQYSLEYHPPSGPSDTPPTCEDVITDDDDYSEEYDASQGLDESLADPEPEVEPVRPARNSDDEWYTPRWLFDALDIRFSVDVCAPVDRTHSAVPADAHFTIEDDGLAQHWHGTVWCNPPYSQTEPWARRMIHHGDGLILSHIPMNAAWCTDLWDACDAIRLFQAMEFTRPDGSSQRPAWWLQLAAFGPVATAALARLQPLGNAAFNKRRVASPMWRRA